MGIDMLKLVLILSLLLMPSVLAFDWQFSCNDSQTLKKYMAFQSCNSTACENYNITQYVNCSVLNNLALSCDNSTNSCKPNIVQQNSYYFIIIIVIAIAIGIVTKVLNWV
jgi:hypothetical protein